jgi:hypothetical protein
MNASEKPAGPVRRRRALLVMAVAVMMIVPAAIAWACGPNRAVQLDRFAYPPGATVTVSGSNFEVGATIDILVNGGTVTSTTVSGAGNIFASFAAPSTPGSYTLTTAGVDSTGQALAGTGNAQTFSVAAAPTTSGGGGGGNNPAPSPGTSPKQTTGNSQVAPGSTSGRSGGSGGGANGRSVSSGEHVGRAAHPVNTTEGVITTAGTTAFAGSVTRQTRVAVATKAASKSARKHGASSTKAGTPSERSAGADLWSGVSSRGGASLIPPAAQSTSGGGSGPALAFGLLAVGALMLGGLGVAEVRRRRKAPTS